VLLDARVHFDPRQAAIRGLVDVADQLCAHPDHRWIMRVYGCAEDGDINCIDHSLDAGIALHPG